MLGATPTRDFVAIRPTQRDHIPPSTTPPHRVRRSYGSPMLTPSPLRNQRSPMLVESDSEDPFQSFSARAQPTKSSHQSKLQSIPCEHDPDSPFWDPPKPNNTRHSQPPPSPLTFPSVRVGASSRRDASAKNNVSLQSNSTSLHPHVLTPLKLQPSTGVHAFDRLAPPNFSSHTPKTQLRKQSSSLDFLRLDDAVGESRGFISRKRQSFAQSLLNSDSEESTELSDDGHVAKRRACPQPTPEKLVRRRNNAVASRSSVSSKSDVGSPFPRRHANKRASVAAAPRHNVLGRADSATLFFGPPIAQPDPSSSPRSTVRDDPWTKMRGQSTSPKSSPPGTQGDYTDWSDDDDCKSAFVFSLNEGTPPPAPSKLPTKYKPRDSGIGMISDGGDFFGMKGHPSRSSLSVMPQASTSASTINSDADGLVTPGVGPGSESGWPDSAIFINDGNDFVHVSHPGDLFDADVSIMRALDGSHRAVPPKRAPETPAKKFKSRPWQSAVANKVGLGFDLGPKNKPRKSLPLVLSAAADDSEDEETLDSPSSGKKNRLYTGLGVGIPANIPKTSRKWLMRRSSSGNFSSGSETASVGTPTTARHQLAPPRSPLSMDIFRISPSRRALTKHSPARPSISSIRSASSSSNGSIGSPTLRPVLQSPAARRSRSMCRTSSQSLDTRFERSFIALEEIGSGEFGKVMKVRTKIGADGVFAVKQSKRFEGERRRLRLCEEAEILRHLRDIAARNGAVCHPNVLSYVDHWEEEQILFIQTELCDMGNFSHFLWEYGRTAKHLDEGRVWKILADLADGLNFVHSAGVLHLDLKPANILITCNGRFKIADFGMATLWLRPVVVQASGVSKPLSLEREGDKLYLAPEVLQGRYSKSVDVFSLGMTILETTTNIIVPDQGGAWHRLRSEDFSQIVCDMSTELLHLIQQMMRTEPAMRIDSQTICAHPVVCRARASMQHMAAQAEREGAKPFVASPLGTTPPGFLDEILDKHGERDARMDTN
ncbi:kinase-like protein [Fistulina hepatica ATCC 64428]|uniref:Kinase-like protein n=1 Tax=Fistulina hepatica ATCC 64428 TaxID=1128425 RepID=A0A0D7ADL3_9AGAR|nr:kinase-like protein [Fistulina hepatica ATCC 64428]